MKSISRNLEKRLEQYASYFPVTAILGPRQCGKTTLARQWISKRKDALYLDLELPSDLAKLQSPEDFLRRHSGRLVCLDEVQRLPEIFPVLRALSDLNGAPGQFLVLGSASPEMMHQTSESLAGRIGYLELTPFVEREIGAEHRDTLWMRGGFPRSFLAPSDELSRAWLDNFILTFLERDIPQFGIRISPVILRRFWQMCAHFHGELWNHSKVAGSLGTSGKTVSHYLAVLENSYMLRRLQPYNANVKKRLTRSSRVYIRDTGLLHRLLGIDDRDALDGHPVKGNSWESYVIEQISEAVPEAELFFYRTAAGAEIDLVIRRGNAVYAVEIKASSSPKLEKGFHLALQDVKPRHAWIAAPVTGSFLLPGNIEVASPQSICESLHANKTHEGKENHNHETHEIH